MSQSMRSYGSSEEKLNESFGTQILHWLCYYAVSQKNVPSPNIFPFDMSLMQHSIPHCQTYILTLPFDFVMYHRLSNLFDKT